MNKIAPFALLATVATLAVIPSAVFAAEASQSVQAGAETAATAPVSISAGKMLYGPDANRIGSIYRVNANGDAQIIINGRLLTVPVSTLSSTNGKVATNLTKSQILHR
jgi:hypothetical protein